MLTDLTRAVNALPQNMTSQMFSAIAAVTGQGQNPNATPAQWASSQYGYGGSGGGSSAYHVRGLERKLPMEGGEVKRNDHLPVCVHRLASGSAPLGMHT